MYPKTSKGQRIKYLNLLRLNLCPKESVKIRIMTKEVISPSETYELVAAKHLWDMLQTRQLSSVNEAGYIGWQ